VVVLVGGWGVKLAVPRSWPVRSRGFSLRRVRIRVQRVLLREVMRVVSSWREGNGGILVLVLVRVGDGKSAGREMSRLKCSSPLAYLGAIGVNWLSIYHHLPILNTEIWLMLNIYRKITGSLF
jgi:hypothetical protein